MLAQEAWEVVRLPTLAEADEELRTDTVLGPTCFRRRSGEALQPEREPPAVLDHIRRTIGEYNFAGQYQQAPAPLGGGLVKAVWFPRYRPDELPPRFERIVQSWDTANKAGELSDFSVCTSWGVAGKNLYLIDVLRRRMEYPELKRAVREQYERFGPDVVLIEDRASGTQLIQELLADGLHAVTRYWPQSDKIMRMHAQTAMVENGFVHLPERALWLAPYLAELTTFPNGKHDDQVDSTAQMLTGSRAPPASRAASMAITKRSPKSLAIRGRSSLRDRRGRDLVFGDPATGTRPHHRVISTGRNPRMSALPRPRTMDTSSFIARSVPTHKVAALQPAARGKRRETGSQLRGRP